MFRLFDLELVYLYLKNDHNTTCSLFRHILLGQLAKTYAMISGFRYRPKYTLLQRVETSL